MNEQFCVRLDQVRRDDLAIAGGKGANLGELLHAGFDVPHGFIVTTHAYRTAVGAARSVDDVRGAGLPSGVDAAIRQAYGSMSGGAVAVRSSATAEDLPGAAFAGQQDTFLDVEGEDAVVAAVLGCWASLFTERAVAYRDRLGIESATVAMAVVVQAMVPADVAGVMFTADPVTGARDTVVIDAARGLGEAVVSGTVIPDHFLVDHRDHIVERRVVAVPSLREDQIPEIAAVGRRIAEHFGAPQDIEWAIREGRLSILQSRAMTALPPPPRALNRFQRFIGPTLLEMLPRRPYPMELTAWILPTVAAHVAEMMEQLVGVRISWGEMLPARDAIVQEFAPPSPHPTAVVPLRIARTVARGLRGSTAPWQEDPLTRAYRSGAAALDRLDPSMLSLEELVDVPRRASTLVELMTRLRVERLPGGLVGMVGLRLVLVGRTKVLPELIGHVPTMTRAANDELAGLAADAVAIGELRKLLEAGELGEALTCASSLPAAADWWRRFQCFLDTYGHRETTSIMLLHDPAWVDSPTTVMGLIRVLMEQGGADEKASAPTSLLRRSGVVRGLGRLAARGVAFREDTHFELTRTFPAVRSALNEVGRRLARDGRLDDAEDVWMLTLQEVTRGVSTAGSDAFSLREAATRRRAAWAVLAATPLIASSTLYPHRRASPDALVTGAAGGGGRATGAVRVIDGPDQFGDLRSGEVLVCEATNPSWTPLFQRAAAVVVDHGGVASHAAIVAREYGIPAVMGAATATTILHDGQCVVVDGDRGEVMPAPDPG
ncbi:PEP/pyruvate-binding domain-containing protein [Tessaracoccus antarcticus]|uniref:Phosphoenolpyruvate synthase n=1 Tax=Tessaracoccus antarcticus TaxID=2479848 RepID=A0A3M0G861_9ACTN|nr:PEP/pyruvate-binding domain-containing protein [Tessaracoccus antarcticus]RMB61220.1 phosphoenolpyruvate synthase [Tessaracoccus antarcticus]